MIRGCIVPILLFVIALCLCEISCSRIIDRDFGKIDRDLDELELRIKIMQNHYNYMVANYAEVTNTLNYCYETVKKTNKILIDIDNKVKGIKK